MSLLPMLLGPLIGGTASIIGGGQQNQANWDNARAAEQFSERMSNTARQRDVQDLTKAGLNPILAVNAGSSTPTGQSAHAENTLSGLASSAMDAANLRMQMEKQESELSLMAAQEKKTRAETTAVQKTFPKQDALNEIISGVSAGGHKIKESLSNSAKEIKEYFQKPYTIEKANPKNDYNRLQQYLK